MNSEHSVKVVDATQTPESHSSLLKLMSALERFFEMGKCTGFCVLILMYVHIMC